MNSPTLSHGFGSLLEAIYYVQQKGYQTEFLVDDYGFIDDEHDLYYYPTDISHLQTIRLSAPFSDPDEESILYLLQMNDGRKGWLSDSYGVYANSNLATHLNQVKG